MSKLDALADVVSPTILQRASDVSAELRKLGVRHALIGGLAVGVHGHVRATKDVDFLVGGEAFASMSPRLVFREELTDLVRIGFIDLMSVPPDLTQLDGELAIEWDMPVISLPALVLLKLDANRPRDRDDVHRLMMIHRARLREVRDYVQRYAPALVHRLGEILGGA